MKLCLQARSPFFGLAASTFCLITVLPACGFFERADANNEQEEGGGDGSGGGDAMGTGGAPASGGMMNLAGAGPGTGGGDPGYEGGCPVEPCPETGGENLILNGDFSQGATGWNGWNGTLDVSSGAGCIVGANEPAEAAGIGWDNGTGVMLEAGTYTFSFDITTEVTPTILARVGGIVDPFPTYGEQTFTAVASGPQTIMVTITEPVTAGLVFFVSNGAACIDNASLTKN